MGLHRDHTSGQIDHRAERLSMQKAIDLQKQEIKELKERLKILEIRIEFLLNREGYRITPGGVLTSVPGPIS